LLLPLLLSPLLLLLLSPLLLLLLLPALTHKCLHTPACAG
jgi:hypothetical protein